ncbi:unnamed protein product [Cyprideis torosa]|uniref:Uncharacterized protein n=1 Tax=Cyprideis torosa TaxID=163714 RepID=A0A7R8WHZ6_9CRUS|nr:unnamed protein product [Cyprideis torosa]CAG0893560.1 unnamed protein product [Cyprideis torosa]
MRYAENKVIPQGLVRLTDSMKMPANMMTTMELAPRKQPSSPYAQALEKVAGGRLFHVVVDTNDTATAILQRGRLQRRTTFVPLNVVRSYRIPNSKINFAKQLVGEDRVHSALSLVEYPPELEAAMVYAFGGSLIADDVDIGSKVCFHPNVHSHVVTLDGEAFNPEETATAELEAWKTERTLKINKQKDIEGKLRNAKEYQKEALKEANSAVAKAEKAAKESRANWESQEKQADELLLELQTLKEQIQTQKEQEAEINKELAEKRDSLGNKDQEIREAQESVAEARSHVKREKDALNALMKESGQLEKKKNSLKQEIADRGLKKQKLETEGKSANAAYEHATQKLVSLKKDNPWIQDQEKYFGKEGTLFDFKNQDPKQVASDLAKVKNDKEKIEKKINFHTMDRLQEIEGQYDSLMAKLKTIKLDKVKIEKFIQEIENKKEESIIEACQKINSDFGKIFSTLLPGASAKLVPPVDKNGRETTVLDGLELKVAFGNAWKESLVELSGGQRSLLALSLILAMLVYKPAPLYILDEIDAALDLSHTQNIGKIIKQHFKQSQFVIVSLKDGMFNNANVLFRTAFKDGMSEVRKTGQRINT